MVESAYHIEDVAIKKCDIVMNKDKNINRNGKDKNKHWNKKKCIINDGVVDAPKTKESRFNLSNSICTTKQKEGSNPQTSNKNKKNSKKRHVYTLMVKHYEVVLMTLIAKKLVMLLKNSHPYNLLIRSPWLREDHIYSYHRKKGHNTKHFFKLKSISQYLMDVEKL